MERHSYLTRQPLEYPKAHGDAPRHVMIDDWNDRTGGCMTIVLMVMAVLLWCWLLLSCLPAGAEAHMPMPYLIALIPLLWVPSLALAAISACVHAWTPLVAFMLTAVASVARLWPYWAPTNTRETVRETSSGAATEPRTARSLRVMTVNCRYGRADAHAIVREVRQRHIDVLATQETTDDLVERLREAGLDSLLPHRQLGTSRPITADTMRCSHGSNPVGRRRTSSTSPQPTCHR